MSDAEVILGGQFIRLRDNQSGYAQQERERERRQQKLDADRIAKEAAENFRRETERQAKLKANEQIAWKAFREYHNTPAGGYRRSDVMNRYALARGYCSDNVGLSKAVAELNDPEFMKRFYPEKYAVIEKRAAMRAEVAELKPDFVKCKFCRNQFTDAELLEHYRTTKPCPHRCGSCNGGGEIHSCSVYGAAVIEDRLPVEVEEEVL
jgi:hypothetical protein